jgi:cation diffusion facilitator CzcD-associated flavoprotein CzcO
MLPCDIAIIGAGPYGLSAAAHLRAIKGLEIRAFGEPMSFWNCNMPTGMLLRSNWSATQIADPKRELTLEEYQADTGDEVSSPVPLEKFVRYGLWYQRRAVPDLEPLKVERVAPDGSGFRLTFENGGAINSRRVIIAAGIGRFASCPAEFRSLPAELASHASVHRDLGKFRSRRVLVIGTGQSALESAALLQESGAEVEILGRSATIHWLQGRVSKTLHHGLGKFVRNLLYAPTDVGPAGLSQLMARPHLLKMLPRIVQDKLRKRCVRPAGARWLVDRLHNVPLSLGTNVVSVAVSGGRVRVRLGDGREKTADHVLLGTGYRVDISKYGFLSPDLLASIECISGYPVLRRGFETSVTGLHILGAPAAWSFGPLMQFVSGAGYASRALLDVVTRPRLAT